MNIKKFCLSVFICLFVFVPSVVYAAGITVVRDKSFISKDTSYDPGELSFKKDANITIGGSDSCHAFTIAKKVKGTNESVFCIFNEKYFKSGYEFNSCDAGISGTYKKEDTFKVAGAVLSVVDEKNWNVNKSYIYKMSALNIISRKTNCTFSDNGDLEEIINTAVDKVKSGRVSDDAWTKALTNSISSKTLAISGDEFISEKVIFSGLTGKYNDVNVKYKISVSGLASGDIYLCTSTAKSSCNKINSGYTIDNTTINNGEVSYYVRVVNGTEKDSFSLKLNGDVSYEYPVVNTYCYSSGWQPLGRRTTGNESLSQATSLTLKLPSRPNPETVSHEIEIMKTNHEGLPIGGAEFRLTVKETGDSLAFSSSEDGSIFTYTSGTYTVDNDEFLNKTYCFEETKSPIGYIRNKASERNCYQITSNSNTSTCYKQSADSDNATVVEDKNYCRASYTCPAEYPRMGDDKCYKDETADPVLKCSDGSDPNADNKCPVEIGDAIQSPENETELICTEGTLVDGKCYNYDDPTLTCPNGVLSNNVCNITSDIPRECTGGEGAKDAKYCEDIASYSLVEINGGNVFVTEVNEENSIKISKVLATTEEEVAGAKLKICTKDDYLADKEDCSATKTVDDVTLDWVSGGTPREYKGISSGTYYVVETLPPNGYKVVRTATEFSIDDEGKITVGEKIVDDNLVVIDNDINDVTVSKIDTDSGDELPGARIAICNVLPNYKILTDSSNDDMDDLDDDSNAVETSLLFKNVHPTLMVDGDDSDDDTDSSDDLDGELESESEDADEAPESIDDFNDLVADKNDELEYDDSGNCIAAILSDGSVASWVSGEEPKKISGLPAGTYYLVELEAPEGYSTAESIKFVMKENGTVVDANGKSFANNMIVMGDDAIVPIKTGDILLLVLTAIFLVGLGFGSYYYFDNKDEIHAKFRKVFLRNA